MKSNITAGAAFFLLLGLAGGMENGHLAMGTGFFLMALCLLVMGFSIYTINRREKNYHAKRKSAQHGGNHARRNQRTYPKQDYHRAA